MPNKLQIKTLLAGYSSLLLGSLVYLSYINIKLAWVNYLSQFLYESLGKSAFIISAILISQGVILILLSKDFESGQNLFCRVLLSYFLVLQSSLILINEGYLGQSYKTFIVELLGELPSIFIAYTSILLALFSISPQSTIELIKMAWQVIIKQYKSMPVTDSKAVEVTPVKIQEITKPDGFKLPNVSIFSSKSDKVEKPNFSWTAGQIQETYKNFGVQIEMVGQPLYGPTITQYFIKKSNLINIDRVTSLAADLELALNTASINFNTLLPGKPGLIALEVPNKIKPRVRLQTLLNNIKAKGTLQIPLGLSVPGQVLSLDLTKLPHLLVAGASGSGKTVWLHSMLASLLSSFAPSELQLILIDMKRTEFNKYIGVPHLLTDIITEGSKAYQALNWLVNEMGRRQDIIAAAGSTDITEYNRTHKQKIAYIVCVIDEFAELMAVQDVVTKTLQRLSSLARAAGIHLVLATQTPNKEIVTSLIKNNLQGRIAFRVPDFRASNLILDSSGAEKLTGDGDGLTIAPGLDLVRFQGAFIDSQEIKDLVSYLKKQSGYSVYNSEILDPAKSELLAEELQQQENKRIKEATAYVKEAILKTGKVDVNIIHKAVSFKIDITRNEIDQVVYPILESQKFLIKTEAGRRQINPIQ